MNTAHDTTVKYCSVIYIERYKAYGIALYFDSAYMLYESCQKILAFLLLSRLACVQLRYVNLWEPDVCIAIIFSISVEITP